MRKRLIGIGLVVTGAALIVLSQLVVWNIGTSLAVRPAPVERLIPTAGPTTALGETVTSDSPASAASSSAHSTEKIAASTPTPPPGERESEKPAIPAPTATSSLVPAAATPSLAPTVIPPPTSAASTPSPAPTATQVSVPALYHIRQRIGIGVPSSPFPEGVARQLNPGWYLDWTVSQDPLNLEGLEYMPMVRLRGNSYSPSLPTLAKVAAKRPGSLWLIGNEPDVKWQDNALPGDYARLYHDLYVFLKQQDPSCRIAVGGVSQPTPLRLRYLEAVLNAYQDLYGTKMPVDVWNVHAFILREEADSWGIDIPPGFPDKTGKLYEIKDHDDMAIFKEQIVTFRRWMKDHGEQDKPLIVSEYGILMPEDYGFPLENIVRFMYATFDYFLTASDPDIGYAKDGGRLVQRWAWFSLADTKYPTGNLIEQGTVQLTILGEAYAQYVASHLD